MGFSDKWVGKIMECVSSVSFSFLINGSKKGRVIPTRGLCQGDSISPYFFILCAEAFSLMISKAANDGQIHGAQVCRGAPVISHLFFFYR